MSEKKVPQESQLVRRTNGRYYFRAYVPPDVRALIPGSNSGQKWIALGTADEQEAKRRKRIKAVEFDRDVEAARKRLAGHQDRLTQQDAEALAAQWLAQVLEEDEDTRREGLDSKDFRKKGEAADIISAGAGYALARGDASLLDFEMEELLSHNGLNVPRESESWTRLGFEMLKAQKRWGDALTARQLGEIVETPKVAPPPSGGQGQGPSVSQLIDAYLADPRKKRTPGTLKTYRTVFRALKEVLGPETQANSVHRQHCEQVRDLILRLPKHSAQRFKDMTLEDAARVAEAEGLERMKPATVNAYLGTLASLFKWGVKTWRISRNPAEGLLVHDPVADIDRKQPFSLEHLKAIFHAPLYTGCVDDKHGYATPGPQVVRRARFWVPLLSLWTGMRLGECCQLHTADVEEVDGVLCILINDSEAGADDADRKRVKTAAGRRFVPVHPELISIGFPAFVTRQRASGHKRLFPDLKADKLGYLSGPFGKWFNDPRRFLGKVGLSGQGVSFHSFRHSYRDALREAGISLERVRALGGWSRDSDGEEARYGKGLGAVTLFDEISKVRYPGLELKHLHELTAG